MGKFYQCIQSYGPSFMTKFCSALYLENLLTNIFAKLNLRGGVSCMPAALLLFNYRTSVSCVCTSPTCCTCEFSQVLFVGVPGGFSRVVLQFSPHSYLI